MFLWGVLLVYVVISGFILIFSKKYGFRIAIALGLLMLFIFEDTPKDTFFAALDIGLSLSVFSILLLVAVFLWTKSRRKKV